MNAAQITKFHTLKSRWIKVRKETGRPHDDAALSALKRQKIGRDCSSKDLTQKQFDDMIGAFMAEIEPANFNAQMEQQDQPEKRHAVQMAKCRALCLEMSETGGEYHLTTAEDQDRYIGSISQRLHHKWPEACDDGQLAAVAGVLAKQAERCRAALQEHAANVGAAQKAWIAAGRPEGEVVDAHPMPRPAKAAPLLEPGEDF